MTTRSTNPASYGAAVAALGTDTLPTTWEHPISWDALEKYFKGALNQDTRKVFNMLMENSKSLEDHLDTAYLKNSGGTVAGSTTFSGSVTLPGTISLGGTLISTLSFPPSGSIMPYAGTTAPPGWLLCDGTPYSTTTYAALFAVCGSTYNTSAGQSAPTAGNFRVPNLKGRMPVGLDAAVTDFNTTGKSGGSTTVTITVAQMPSHQHVATASLNSGLVSISETPHSHGVNPHSHTNQVTTIIPAGSHAHDNVSDYVAAGTNGASTSPTVASISSTSLTTNTASTGISASVGTGITVTNPYVGGGNAVDNMSPYLVLNYIIKT